MKRIEIDLRIEKKSEILLGSNLLFSQEVISKLKSLSSDFALFCDTHIAPLIGEKWCAYLQKEGLNVSLFSFPAGEGAKSSAQKEELENLLFSQKGGRETCCIALGGGVTTDLIGFLASTFCRGTPLVFAPTTFLGMVDAAIGGKTGINNRFGKNLIGTFYPADTILIDPSILSSLPPSEWTSGFAEVIKYSLIRSPTLFQTLKKIKKYPPADLLTILTESIEIKTGIIAADFEEKTGMRRILNFGHTIAHAIERIENYEISHGEAVAIGMLVESYISWKMGYLSSSAFQEIEKLICSFSFALKLQRGENPEEFFSALSRDKKAIHGIPRFVLLEKIGSCCSFEGAYCTEVPLLKEALVWMIAQFGRR